MSSLPDGDMWGMKGAVPLWQEIQQTYPRFNGCSETSNPHNSMSSLPDGDLWGMKGAVPLWQELPQTYPRFDLIPMSVESDSGMLRTASFNQSSWGGAERITNFSEERGKVTQQAGQSAWESFLGTSNVSCPTNNPTEYGVPILHDEQRKKRRHSESTSMNTGEMTNELAPARMIREGDCTVESNTVSGG